jgi:hypothetical protein
MSAVLHRSKERRSYGRIHLETKLRGSVDAVPIFVAETSVTGVRVLHEERFPVKPDGTHQLWFDWNEHTLRFRVELIRTTIVKLAKRTGEKSLYDSGLRFVHGDAKSEKLLRDLIADYVVRSLNEQIANAHGIPPLAAYSYQTGKGSRFRRCEWINGSWRKAETFDPQQPENGFTISADLDPEQVDILCKTWEIVGPEGRRLTQLLAQLSISKMEGIPTRRYEP